MSLSKFRTLLTTFSAPKQKPQVTTTVRLLQAHNINSAQSTKMSTGTPNPAPQPTEPKQSMIGGHAQYVKGMVNEKIGAATGSQEWVESGQKDMTEGRGAMKEAQAAKRTPGTNNLGGKIEEMAGRATGCEGMVEEGNARQTREQ